MANCTYCGGWAGMNETEHPDCKAKAGMPVLEVSPSELDAMALAAHLKPIIEGAAWRAGVGAALTFAGLLLIGGIVWGVVSSAVK